MRIEFLCVLSLVSGAVLSVLPGCGGDSTPSTDTLDAITIGDTVAGGDSTLPDSATSDSADSQRPGDTITGVDGGISTSCETSAECSGGEICNDGKCREVCSPDAPCDGARSVCDPDTGFCVDCLRSLDCRGGEVCEAGECVRPEPDSCTLLDERCDGRTRYFCDGDELRNEDCPTGTFCQPADAQSPTCQSYICEPDAVACDGDNATVCSSDGSRLITVNCNADQTCADGLCIRRPCENGTMTCEGQIAVSCGDDGEEVEIDCESCADSAFGCNCRDGSCEPRTCEPATSRCVANSTQTCREDGSGYLSVVPCEDGTSCRSGTCILDVCEDGDVACIDGDAWLCDEDESDFVLADSCTSDELCVDGVCEPLVCEPGTSSCVGSQQRTCSSNGLTESSTDCASTDRYCSSTTGRCADRLCTPGSDPVCDGDNVVSCNSDGSDTEVLQECGTSGCSDGACNDPCEGRTDLLGCLFVTADFEQLPVACPSGTCTNGTCSSGVCVGATGRYPVGLVVYNPNDVATPYRIANGFGVVRSAGSVGPRAMVRTALPDRLDIAGTQRSNTFYIIDSDLPLALWHEGPNTAADDAYSMDITRILPVSAMGTEYVAVGFPGQSQNAPSFRPTQTIIAAERSALITLATYGDSIAAGGDVPVIGAPASTGVNLLSNRLFSMVPASNTGDLSGIRFTSTTPFALFSSFGCANIPAGVPFCDHLVEQIPPLDKLAGTTFAVTKSPARGLEHDIIRITSTATEGGTVVTTTSPLGGITTTTFTLSPGETRDILATRSFQIGASQPVQVHQYLVGGEYPSGAGDCVPGSRIGCALPNRCEGRGIGDPAMATVIPTDHWSDEHYIYVPPSFSDTTVSIAIFAGAAIEVDGVLSDASRETQLGMDFLHISPGAGVHRLTASEPFGALVVGHICLSSIAYTGEFR